MSWRLIGKPSAVKPSRPIIEEFAEMTPAPGDREHKPWLAARLRNHILRGEFNGCRWGSAMCLENNVTYRVNGKHTSKLFQAMNGELQGDFYITVERYECDTLADVASLYKTFDPRESARQTGDINRAVAATIPEIADYRPALINLCVTAISYAQAQSKSVMTQDPFERAEKLRKEIPFVKWMHDALGIKNKDSKHLWRGPVASAMYLTFHKDAVASTEFWAKVRHGGGAAKSPEHTLERYLLENGVKSDTSDSVPPREMFVKCLHAWNAWREGRQPTRYVHKNPVPKVS